jgi:putative hydrolase of HD superfamily
LVGSGKMNMKNINDRLEKICNFLEEAEKFKLVERIAYLSDRKRRENDAEHSWQLALMILLLGKELEQNFNIEHAIKIALVHDLAEIYTGDCWAETEEEQLAKKRRERIAAEKIFSILPPDLCVELYDLWQEYEEGKTPEAKVVKACDKICYSLQFSISNKEVWPDVSIDRRRKYASKHTSFDETLNNLFEHFLAKLI